MKKIVVLFTVAITLMACNSKKKKEEIVKAEIDSTAVKVENVVSENVLVYEGLLPCADCEGIETILKIDVVDNKFQLSSTYKGKKPETNFIEKGNINTERGLEKDPDGTIYILNWDKPEKDQVYYGYYSKNPEKLYLLDKSKKIIKSKLNYFLELNE
ncbi:copper resistance protein NlpE N-terminal domain-containing protein [Flavobacterium sp. GN10]|uniref:Copper resistance protein NlpE N-terminal domain-containing protein n=1 Tax=Flavobacterium tagetis TaxID=2801336 RepID=A0ABS1KGG7_9FLAO|nr:copper resistance protein NlpE N-terminal domain-containing protein [Flavobacterium tagetis]MBL0738564.1 copper resistance protein NlpE N-terminal domain-containing protein [Flavobacterium tagetis]